MVSEHKDVLKMISMLSTIVSSSKIEAVKVLDSFKDLQVWINMGLVLWRERITIRDEYIYISRKKLTIILHHSANYLFSLKA